jgi:hypothetical protein
MPTPDNHKFDYDPFVKQIELQRKSPTIPVELGGHALELTWYNTLIQLYKAPYQDLSHIEIRGTPQGNIRAFNAEQPAHSLMHNGFPVRYDSEPTNQVAEHYMSIMRDNLDADIEKAFGGGEGNA